MKMLTFENPSVVSLTVAVDADSDSNIAASGTTVTGTKKLTVPGFSATGTAEQAQTVFNKIISGICGANFHMATTRRQINQGVKEVD